MQLKLIIWMNMPSHHQKDFFDALNRDEDIDLKVIYYEEVSKDRKKLGWHISERNEPYEIFRNSDIVSLENSMLDFKDRIHIIPGDRTDFLKKLVDYLINNKIDWVHWSERSGANFAKLLNYNEFLFRKFHSIYLLLSGYQQYGKKVNKFALGAFAQGILAKKDFIQWGISENKISYLFYVQGHAHTVNKSISYDKFKEYKKFIYVGSIERRKGFDILLKAFSKVSGRGWKLVMIGVDRSNGEFDQLVKEFKLENEIDYRGVIPSNEISTHLSSSDVFVFPSRFDGWGMVINEAISAHKPIIASSNAGATHHLVKENKNGFILHSLNANNLSELMQKYINDPDLIINHQTYSSSLIDYISPESNVKRLKAAILRWKNL